MNALLHRCMTNVIIALLITMQLTGQAALHWEDGFWTGDTQMFVLNDDGSLQLNTSDTGPARIWRHVEANVDQRFDFDVRLDFSPSNSNYLRLYFGMTDTVIDISSGYCLHVGATGSPDPIELYAIDSGKFHLLDMSQLSYAGHEWFELSIVSTHAGTTIFLFDQIGTPVPIFQLGSLLQDGHIAIECGYTASRSSHFYFNSASLETVTRDTYPPELQSVKLLDSATLELCFDEGIVIDSAECRINGTQLKINGSSDSWHCLNIALAHSLLANKWLVLEINYVFDTTGNQLSIPGYEFEYNPPRSARVGDVLINEILFTPSTDRNTYVEIIALTPAPITRDDLFLVFKAQNHNDTMRLVDYDSPVPIPPESYLLLTSDTANMRLSYPFHDLSNVILTHSLMLDSGGGIIELHSMSNGLLDKVAYDAALHSPLVTEVAGKALERTSHSNFTHSGSWVTASSQVLWGTPGTINSQSVQQAIARKECSVSSSHLHPMPDGYNDIVFLQLKSPQPASLLELCVYDMQGLKVNCTAPIITGRAVEVAAWNGTDQTGQIVPPGLYILNANMYNPMTEKTLSCRFGISIAASE